MKRAGAPIRELIFDQHRDLAQQAGVTALPTFLLVADGQIIDRFVGSMGRQQLAELVARAEQPGNDGSVVRGQAPPPQSGLSGRLRNFAQRRRSATCELCGGDAKQCRCANAETSAMDLSSAGPIQVDYEPSAPAATPPVSSLTAGTPAAGPDRSDDVVARAIQATVRLRIEDERGVSLGTGTIIDVHGDEALVLTCGHIFRDSAGGGQIRCDLFNGSGRADIAGKLIGYDLRRDVGLVSLRPGIDVPVIPVGNAGSTSAPGDPVFAVGCNRGDQPSVIRNQILAVNRYHGPANLVVGGRPIDGRSGGGLFDANGTLIGVCNAADQQQDEGLYAALGPIHAELDAAGLGFVYRQAPTQVAANSASPQGAANQGPAAAAVDAPLGSVMGRNASQPAGFGNEAEVICIVRPRHANAGLGQAYVLEQPSQDLLNQLSQEMSRRGAHVQTKHREEHTVKAPVVSSSAEGWH